MNPACTAEAAILHTFVEILNVTLRPSQFWCTYPPLQINANLNFGEGEKKYTRGKIGWKGVTWKNLTFSLVFQRNLKSIVATIKSHTGSCYHRIAWQMLFYSRRSAWSSMRRNNYNDLDFHYLMITSGKIFKAAFNTNTKPLKPMPSVDS